MPFDLNKGEYCAPVVTELESLYGNLLTSGSIADNKAIRFLTSRINRANVQLDRLLYQTGVNGSGILTNKVIAKFDKKTCISLCQGAFGCATPVNPVGYESDTHIIEFNNTPYYLCEKDSTTPIARKFTREDLQNNCQKDPFWIDKQIAKDLAAFDKYLNEKMLDIIVNSAGGHIYPECTDEKVKQIPLFYANSISPQRLPNPTVITDIDDEYYTLGWDGVNYAIFGGRDARDYARLSNRMGDSNMFGMDTSVESGQWFIDRGFDRVAAPNQFISIPFGYFQLVNLSFFENSPIDTPYSKAFMLRTPEGFKIDVTWDRTTERGCDEYYYTMKTHLELFQVPQQWCEDECNKANGVFLFENCSNPAPLGCDNNVATC